MQIRKMEPFGVELAGFSMRSASKDDLEAFDAAFKEHSLLLIRDPGMTAEEQVALIGRLGDVAVETAGGGPTRYVAHDPEIANGEDFGKGELVFHFDLIATDDWPYKIMSLFGEEVTKRGGETRFAHGGHAYARLAKSLRERIAGRRAVHIFDPYLPPSPSRPSEDRMSKYIERGVHDVAHAHPYSGEPVLCVAYATTDRIVGMTRAESDALLGELFDALYASDSIYVHEWQAGDLMVWDNRVVQHARNDFDLAERRFLRRVIVGDSVALQTRYRRWAEQRA